MKVYGQMDSRMAMVWRHIQMEVHMKDSGRLVNGMDMEYVRVSHITKQHSYVLLVHQP